MDEILANKQRIFFIKAFPVHLVGNSSIAIVWINLFLCKSGVNSEDVNKVAVY